MTAATDQDRSRRAVLERLSAGAGEPLLVVAFQRVSAAPAFGALLAAGGTGRPVHQADPVGVLAARGAYRPLAALATDCALAFRRAEPTATAVTVVGYCSAAALSLRVAERLAPTVTVHPVLVRPTWPDSGMIESELSRLRANLGATRTACPDLSPAGAAVLRRMAELLDADLRAMIEARDLHAPSVLASGLLDRSVAWLGFLLACREDTTTPWRCATAPTVITGADEDTHVPWAEPGTFPLATLTLPAETAAADRLLAGAVLATVRTAEVAVHGRA